MRRILLASSCLALLALAAAGCGSSGNSTSPNGAVTAQQNADDMAIQTVTALTVVGGDVQNVIQGTPSAPAGPARMTPVHAMWDTTVVLGGITYQASRTFYDASDNPLPGFGPTAVRLAWTSRAYGTFEGARDTATVGHAAALDVHGIQSSEDTLRFDGGSQDTLQNTFRSYDGSRTRYFYWTGLTSVQAVRILKSSYQQGGWPLDGTVQFVISADRLRSNDRTDVEAHLDATVVVTFNGTSQPLIVVNGTYRYRWNMVTDVISRA
jgi:hypothetical protein